ncbi:M48 family metalloprotease [Aeromonas allosaccharophila]|uniref:M48 family metalloprotease n=1 Tax=Aeromonas allosaccharophila TaxID=656 RepID=A0ABZ0FAP1_9GAMM|nr:M48 family metalloprotease [Aeromonas allosaccharophila]WOE66428.1 M48 family metalloprotease [Aeromonas allosaccharophila]
MNRLYVYLLTVAIGVMSGCAIDPKFLAHKPLVGSDRPVHIDDVRMMRQMERTPVLDPALIGYMQHIRQRLETAWDESCDCVVLVDSFGGYEAYSLPDKTIVLSAGLLAQASSEDEIAAVMAHELAHIYHGDNASGSFQQVTTDAVKLGGWVAGGGAYAFFLSDTVDDLAQGQIYRKWNQEQEITADDFSAKLLVKAGYSIDGLKMAIRRLGQYSKGELVAQDKRCISSKNQQVSINIQSCSKSLTESDKTIYQSPELRLQSVMMYTAGLTPDLRRRHLGDPPPKFPSVEYLFGLNDLVSSTHDELRAGIARVEERQIPDTLYGNVAVTNKLASAYFMVGDKERGSSYLRKSFNSSGRTAWTFINLFMDVDRSGDRNKVAKALSDAQLEVGYTTKLLPFEYYLSKRHGLEIYEVEAFARCMSNAVDDPATYQRCAAVDHGGVVW